MYTDLKEAHISYASGNILSVKFYYLTALFFSQIILNILKMTSLTGLVKLNNFVVQSHKIAGFGVSLKNKITKITSKCDVIYF